MKVRALGIAFCTTMFFMGNNAYGATTSIGSVDFSTIYDPSTTNFDLVTIDSQGFYYDKTLYVSQTFVVPQGVNTLENLTIGSTYAKGLSLTINGVSYENSSLTYLNNDWYVAQTFDIDALQVSSGETMTFELHGNGQAWQLGTYEAGQAYSHLVPWDLALNDTVTPIQTLGFEAQFATSTTVPVPEPETWSIMLTGLLSIGGIMGYQRKYVLRGKLPTMKCVRKSS
jgi:hypothetical protein